MLLRNKDINNDKLTTPNSAVRENPVLTHTTYIARSSKHSFMILVFSQFTEGWVKTWLEVDSGHWFWILKPCS